MPEADAELAKLLLEILPPDGGSMGNQGARRALSERLGREVGEEEYGAVRDALVAQGRVAKGRGRGGAVRLVAGEKGASAPASGSASSSKASGARPAVGETEAASGAGGSAGRARKAKASGKRADKGNGAAIGYEAQLWKAADALRGSVDAAEYKHTVLGLLFLSKRPAVI